jgi:hypothetical protein
MLLRDIHYTLESTGADSPSQNGAVEVYIDKFAICTRTFLYGSGLPAKFWSAALLHSLYLHNWLVHTNIKVTPFEGYFGAKPNLSNLKVLGSWVCIKRSGDRSGKLDCNDFTSIFLIFTATNHNIHYLDLESGVVRRSHHTQFDEAWYLQPSCLPAAQLLYDLGLEVDPGVDPDDSTTISPVLWWPPLPTCNPPSGKFLVPLSCVLTPLSLREMFAAHRPMTAAAAQTHANDAVFHDATTAARVCSTSPSNIVTEYLIGTHNMTTVYMSPDPYFKAFEEIINLHKFDLAKHRTTGLCLAHSVNRLFLGSMAPGNPAQRSLAGDHDSKVPGS